MSCHAFSLSLFQSPGVHSAGEEVFGFLQISSNACSAIVVVVLNVVFTYLENSSKMQKAFHNSSRSVRQEDTTIFDTLEVFFFRLFRESFIE